MPLPSFPQAFSGGSTVLTTRRTPELDPQLKHSGVTDVRRLYRIWHQRHQVEKLKILKTRTSLRPNLCAKRYKDREKRDRWISRSHGSFPISREKLS
jgi:hypothetical protein